MLKRRVKKSFKNKSVSVTLSVGDSETRRLGDSESRNVKIHKNETVKSLKMISPGAVQKKVTLRDALPLLNPGFGALPGIEISQ